MIDFKEGRYVLGAWGVSNGVSRDWRCIVYRDEGSAEFRIAYQFRYDLAERLDTSSRHLEIVTDSDEQTVIDSVGKTVEFLCSKGFGHLVHNVEVRSSDPVIARVKCLTPAWLGSNRSLASN